MRYTKLIIFSLLSCWSCGTSDANDAATDTVIEIPATLPEGFADFYQRFLTDSVYQLEHISFPLQGLPNQADSTILADNDFYWTQEDWIVHRPIEAASGFSVNLIPLTEDYVLEKITHESGRYGMERRYVYQDDGWNLIYYAGLNALNVPD